MSHSMLVNNIPYHSRTTIYSQNQDPPPSSLRQFHHPPRETPPKAAERVARSSSSNLVPPSPPFPLPCFFSPLLYFRASSLNPFCLHFFFSFPTLLPLRLARRMKTLKRQRLRKKKGKRKHLHPNWEWYLQLSSRKGLEWYGKRAKLKQKRGRSVYSSDREDILSALVIKRTDMEQLRVSYFLYFLSETCY